MEVSRRDKERLLFFSNEVRLILSEYEETLEDEKMTEANYFAYKLKSCIEAGGIVGESKEHKALYRCLVTEEPIDITDCNVCKTQSCPINTGFETMPPRMDRDKE
jgi:hypothetical protein